MRTVGDQLLMGKVVSIQTVRHTFSRAFHVRNTYVLFKAKTVNDNHVSVTYTLQELDDGDNQGIFFREKLTPVQNQGLYTIERIKLLVIFQQVFLKQKTFFNLFLF